MNIQALLLAISLVETGGNDKAVGRHGEISRYQISRRVWGEYTRLPCTRAYIQMADVIAHDHVTMLEHQIPVAVKDRTWWTAAAWNAGLHKCVKSKWTKSRMPRSTRDYANRVTAIYEQHTVQVR